MKNIQVIIIFNLLGILLNCIHYENYYDCSRTDMNDWDNRCFQTPKPGFTGDPNYLSTYQGMHYLVGYAQLKYSNNKKYCNINFYTRIK